MPLFLQIGLVFLASMFVMRMAGFGNALIAMPLLIGILGLERAAPLMNVVGFVGLAIALAQMWRHLTLRDIWRWVVGAAVTLPIGVRMIGVIPDDVIRLMLGGLVVVFAVYRLANFPPLPIKNENWGIVAGLIAGFFSGIVNIPGPPVVIYAESQDWEPDRFRMNTMSFFLVTSVYSFVNRVMVGQVTWEVVGLSLSSLPFVAVGLFLGWWVSKRIDREAFKRLVLVLLLVIGVRLIWGVIF